MRANTQRIYELLSKGTFLSVDTIDQEAKHLYNDIEENFADYETYFLELGLRLESGDGYYYFARTREAKITIEQKLQSFANGWTSWISSRRMTSRSPQDSNSEARISWSVSTLMWN